MTGEILILNFENDKAYLTEDKFFSLDQIGLPDIARRFNSPVSWKIRVLRYNEKDKRIFAEIISYHTFKQPFPYNQFSSNNELNGIEQIGFKSIDTYALLETLKGGERKTIQPKKEKISYREGRYQNHTEDKVHEKKLISQTIKDTFLIPLKNVRFKSGGVSFDKRIPQLNRIVEFNVKNENIQEEFDAIKNYFGNVLKTKKFRFNVLISFSGNDISNIKTSSPEIDRINKGLIENVKFDFIRSVIQKKTKAEIDNFVFTIEELFTTLTKEKLKSNVFYNNENDLLDDLLKITNTKHYKHLRFLSKKHANLIMKLRFIIKPFSFIFLIEGERRYHIIWETLDTEEATYIWHIEKNLEQLKMEAKKINVTINQMKLQGKTGYINTTEDDFNRIYHDYSEQTDGYSKWKVELKNILE